MLPMLKYGPGSAASSDDEEEAKMMSQLKSGSEAAASSDEDEEANEDLSLKIVEKALLMRAARLASDPFDRVLSDDSDKEDEDEDDVSAGDGVVELHIGKALMEKGEALIGETMDRMVNTDIPKQDVEITIIAAEGKEKVAVSETKDATESMDLSVVETADNMVLRKLLRGPRYFDAPGSSSQACYNCGEEGHAAANCSQKRKRPCFCCGSLEHKSRDCRKEKCFVCNTNGHKAKDCPEKKNRGLQADKICLKCGMSGHEMRSCGYNYSPEDLKEIQCYVCQNLGHLCCVDSVDDNRSEISCYRCGLLGHDGSGCSMVGIANKVEAAQSSCFKCGEKGHFARECKVSSKSGNSIHEGTLDETLSLCYKCGQEGHFARECTVSKKRSTRLSNGHQDEVTPSSCYKCGEVGHFARDCSQLRKRNLEPSTPVSRFYERDRDFYSGLNSHSHSKNSSKRKNKNGIDGSSSKSQKKKSRGGWITEEPESPKLKKYAKNNGWMSRGSNFNGTEQDFYSPSPRWMQNSRYGESSQPGYSASRFNNSRSESSRRKYWW